MNNGLNPLNAAREWIENQVNLCPETEPEQAALRLAIGGVALSYFFAVDAIGDASTQDLVVLYGFTTFSWILFAWILVTPRRNVLRRLLGMCGDIGCSSYAMYTVEEVGAPFYVIFLWVIFGNGFRYGLRYLFVATAMSATGFTLVLHYTEYWAGLRVLGVALLLGIIVLPLYVAALISRLNSAMQRAEDANKAKTRFLASISHEIRTPLNGIVGIAHILESREHQKDNTDAISSLRVSADTLSALIGDVLDFAKIEAGKTELRSDNFSTSEIVETTIQMLCQEAQRKGIYLKKDVDRNIPILSGDPIRVRQILLNITGNAVKFTLKGGVTLRAFVLNSNQHTTTIRFEISDTGPGISSDFQGHLFDSFSQADTADGRQLGGTGLGTAISQGLVTQMGGKIDFTTDSGGTIFYIDIPFGLAKTCALEISPTVEPSSNRKILIAEDNPINQKVLTTILESAGHYVSVVDNGYDALEAMLSGTHDLAIVDMQMPGLDGISTIREYRQKSDHCLPIVVLTANATQDSIDACEALGVDDYVTKPLHAVRLLAKVTELTRHDVQTP